MEARVIDIEPDSELGHAIEDAADVPIILVRNGVRYRVLPENRTEPSSDERPPGFDRKRLEAGMRAAAGVITPEQAEEWIANIYRWREEGSRPPDRP